MEQELHNVRSRVYVSPMTGNIYPVSVDGEFLKRENQAKDVITDVMVGAHGIIAGYNPWSSAQKRWSETRMMHEQSGRCTR